MRMLLLTALRVSWNPPLRLRPDMRVVVYDDNTTKTADRAGVSRSIVISKRATATTG